MDHTPLHAAIEFGGLKCRPHLEIAAKQPDFHDKPTDRPPIYINSTLFTMIMQYHRIGMGRLIILEQAVDKRVV
jgi:hypothetical protein